MNGITFDNVFINPCVPLVFTSTINSELGDTDIQNFNFTVSGMDKQQLRDFNIFPNPVSTVLNIQLEEFSSELLISVYDINGKIVFSNYKFYNTVKVSIDVSHLSSSMYLIVIENDNRIDSKTFYKD